MSDNTETTHGKIQGKVNEIQKMVEKTALGGGGGDPFHSTLYLNVQDGEVNIITGSPGNQTIGYSTFDENFVDEISAEREEGAEALINVGDFQTYLGFASDEGTVEVSFVGEEDDRLATACEITGNLNSRYILNSSEKILNDVPLSLVDMFDENEQYESANGKTLDATIKTSISQLQKIEDVVDHDDEVKYYPVVVEDGEFKVEVGDRRNGVWGELQSEKVEGPDVSNIYDEGYNRLTDTLVGDVLIRTSPSGAPLCVIQKDEKQGLTVRHLLGSVAE